MSRIVWVIELASCEGPDLTIAGDQMQVNMPILILKKSVIKVIGIKCFIQCSSCNTQLML